MLNIFLVCLIILVALVLFISEKLRVDMIAILIMATLMIIGVFRPGFLSVHEAISGFSNEATITIAAMFILSSGLVKTGSITIISHRLIQFGGHSELRLFLALMITAGTVSAFINNTAAVAVFIPITLTICRQHQISPSRLLLPLSYVSIVGGTCTLIGTSTNILVSSMSANAGFGEFGMFQLTRLGLIFFVFGLFYLTFVGRRLLPAVKPPTNLTAKYRIGRYFTLLVVPKKSPLVLRTAAQCRLSEKYDVTILEIVRGEERIWSGLRDIKFHEGDELLVRGSIHSIMEMNAVEGLFIRSQLKYADQDLSSDEAMLAEAVISSSASLIGGNLRDLNFRRRFGVNALAIKKHGETIRERIGNIRLEAGDTLLVQGKRVAVEELFENPNFVMLQEFEVPPVRRHRAPLALATVALVVALAAFEVMPILVSAITGCLVMILFGCIRIQEAYESIDWFVIFLLAGVIPLGIAMENTGTAVLIAEAILQLSADLGPVALISVFYLLTTIFASIMSHNAAVILLVPIGIASANELGINPLPILMSITFAASSALSTPFGYHTNLMVYGPGGYRFADYLKVGLPLNILLWIMASLLIPFLWPLR